MITFKLFSDGYIYCTDLKNGAAKIVFFCTSRFLIALLDFVKERIIKRNYGFISKFMFTLCFTEIYFAFLFMTWLLFIKIYTYLNGHIIFSHCYPIKYIVWGCATQNQIIHGQGLD